MCEIERSDPNYEKRERLVAQFNEETIKGNIVNAEKCDLNTLLDYEIKIKKMYKPGQPYQTHMNSPLLALVYFHRGKGDTLRRAETYMRLFELNKDIDNLFSFKMLFLAYIDYLLAQRNEEASKTQKITENYLIGSFLVYSYTFELALFKKSLMLRDQMFNAEDAKNSQNFESLKTKLEDLSLSYSFNF